MVRPIVENAIGIDLGTTNCCVGFMQNGVVKIIPNLVTDERTTPSYVFFQNTETHVGKLAMNNVPVSPEKVVYDAKRMIGRSYHDENIQKNLHYWKFRVEEGPSSKPLIRIPKGNGREIYTPEEISSIILRQLKSQAEKFTGKTVKNAVVTVPAYFNYHQRTATQKAAEDAGLNVLQIINEPTAAALAYVDVNYRNQSCDKKILIYDLGGGTFDVSILHVKKNDVDESFKVLATSGDTYLGGRDFDNNLTDLILQKLRQKEITINNKLTRRVSALASKTKIDLTEAEQTNVVLPFIDNDEDEDFFITVTRSEFNSINEHLFQRTIDIVDKSLEDAGLNDSRVDEIVLVGGSSKIPKIRNLIETRFPRIPVTESVSSSEAVAYGATIRAVTFEAGSNRALSIQDVTPLSLGTDIIGDRMSFVIGRNSTIPVEIRTRRYTVKDNQTSMHFTIYEGERLFVKDNTKLGSFVVDLPPKPIGRPVDVIFSLDENGVLTVGAEVDSKIYKNLSILYEPTNPVKASSLVEDANLSKSVDNAALKRATRMVNLKLYVRKISALCDRKSRLTESQKKILRDIANDTLRWVELYDGCQCDVTEQIDLKVRDKEEEVDRIVEPILKKYRYEVKNVCIGDFYEFLMTLN